MERSYQAGQTTEMRNTSLEEEDLEVLPEKSLAIIASVDQQMMTDIPFSFQRPQQIIYELHLSTHYM
jgi:hypothetical protein